MDNEEVVSKLKSVGKQAFIKHFVLFSDYSVGVISKASAIEHLVAIGTSNEAGASIRLSNAKLIFQNSKQHEALHIVTSSKRLPNAVKVQAQLLLEKYA